MALYSLQIERHTLSGLLKHPAVFAEINCIANDNDYWNEINRVIFSVIKSIYLKGEKPDPILTAEKVKNLGITFKEDFDVFSYIDSLYHSQITEKGCLSAFKQLISYRIKRDLHSIGENIKSVAADDSEMEIEGILGKCTSLFNKSLDLYKPEDVPLDLFDDIVELIEDRGNSPKEDMGYLTKYPVYNKLFGGLRPGSVYGWCARPKNGKTSLLNSMCFDIFSLYEKKIKILYLDTEMETTDMKFRTASAISGVPFHFLETGKFRLNNELYQKFQNSKAAIQSYKNGFYHYQVANKGIEQICSTIRRWYYSEVGIGKPCVVVYDYLKLTGERADKNWAEHQIIADKINKLKEIAGEIKAPILTAMQLNRSAESTNKKTNEFSDDSSAIALSDRLLWFAAGIFLFRRKNLEEQSISSIKDFGTHKMIPLEVRFQGQNAQGHSSAVKRIMPDGKLKFCQFYLNYDLNNFKVEEKGSIEEEIQAEKDKHNYQFNSTPENVDLDKNENSPKTEI